MEVIILAGGLGTRLKSVVKDVPKCMAPVADRPFLSYLFDWLKKYDVSKIILSVGYLREVIEEWVDINKRFLPFEIEYAVEVEPLGTGGGIRLAMEKVHSDQAIVLNGDTFFDVNLSDLLQEHNTHKSMLSIALKPMRDFDRYGKVDVENDVILEFKEKQYCDEGFINGGIYVLNKKSPIFDNLPVKFSFETEVLYPLSKLGKVYGFKHDDYFIDIGIPDDYNKANVDFKEMFQV